MRAWAMEAMISSIWIADLFLNSKNFKGLSTATFSGTIPPVFGEGYISESLSGEKIRLEAGGFGGSRRPDRAEKLLQQKPVFMPMPILNS